MEGLLIASLFWDNVVKNNPQSLQEKNPHYFPTVISQEEENRNFYLELAKPKEERTALPREKIMETQNKKGKENGKMVVVFAPHPDDETLCCAETIEQGILQGDQVKIVYLTDGDALDKTTPEKARAYGDWRKVEAKNVARDMGLESEDLFFLGFPDGELHNLDQYGTVKSRFTERIASSRGSYFPQSTYSRDRLKKNITSLFNRLQPDEVYMPSQKDKHLDHKIAGKILHEIMGESSFSSDVYEYIVHGKSFLKTEAGAKNERKLKLIQKFRSQFWTERHRDFMERWAWIPETFSKVRQKIVQE